MLRACISPTPPTARLVPVGKDLLGLLDLFVRAGEVKLQFSCPARDVNLDRGQTIFLHSQLELFVSLAYSVTLKTCHSWRVTPEPVESNGKWDAVEKGGFAFSGRDLGGVSGPSAGGICPEGRQGEKAPAFGSQSPRS